jgi:hypothetical protein
LASFSLIPSRGANSSVAALTSIASPPVRVTRMICAILLQQGGRPAVGHLFGHVAGAVARDERRRRRGVGERSRDRAPARRMAGGPDADDHQGAHVGIENLRKTRGLCR